MAIIKNIPSKLRETDQLDNLIVIDVDHCTDLKAGELFQMASNIISAMQSHTEQSPSGNGIRRLGM